MDHSLSPFVVSEVRGIEIYFRPIPFSFYYQLAYYFWFFSSCKISVNNWLVFNWFWLNSLIWLIKDCLLLRKKQKWKIIMEYLAKITGNEEISRNDYQSLPIQKDGWSDWGLSGGRVGFFSSRNGLLLLVLIKLFL